MISMLSIALGGQSTTPCVLRHVILNKDPVGKLLTRDSTKGWTVVRLGRALLALGLRLNGLKASGGMLEWYDPYNRRWKKWIWSRIITRDKADSLST